MKRKNFLALLLGSALLTVILAACASATTLPPTPTPLPPATDILFPTETVPATLSPSIATATTDPLNTISTATLMSATPSGSTNICADPQVTALIDSLKTAIHNADGPLLASLVSPASGMDVRYLRDGMVVNYDQDHAKFLFETTFEVDWGAEPGSGAERTGSFHDVIVPELKKVFDQSYTLHCNELKYGGASYDVRWPYQKEFYSVYFPGTTPNGNMDWRTWVVGIEYVNGKPYIYALEQFFWEP